MSTNTFPPVRAALAVLASLSLTGCAETFNTMGNLFSQEEPAPAAATLPRPNPDARGVITYQSFQVAVARDGDNIESIAGRVGLSAASLAQHNGLPVTYRPRPGEVLALPGNVGGSMSDNDWSPLIASNAITAAELEPITSGALDDPGTGDNPFANGQSSNVIEPIRHRVEPGETAFTIARRYGVSVTALAEWNGLDRDMTVRAEQELLIPVTDARQAALAPVATDANPPGSGTPLAPPPSAADPLPANQDLASIETPASPNLAATRTEPTPEPTPAPAPAPAAREGGQFLTPVASGSVLRGYDPAAAVPNEGIDFAAPAGSPVRAAEQGEVALISKSLGGLGTIVLIRHADNLMTVYGRVSDVTLKKGDRVSRGQTIGTVAPGDTPNVHFEVRQGTASVDPGPYL